MTFAHNLDWTVDAACRPHPAWTSETKPEPPLQAAMRAVCDHCPVKYHCAATALSNLAEGGFYAGEWIPPRTARNRWQRARARLTVVAAKGAA